ncbi:MgtC/SapB family protein [Solirhodobacter olei]|uniref:MgtC/SapB family protein n=1 Tax=Solirhodobacter olei TaxID=2493082 RepID=UPI0019D43D54|nr:MgtC/SapB family protein [Solirhodobacter olei]
MTESDLFYRLGVATAIGLMVGLERGWREREAESGSRTAGIRTYAVTGLLGGSAMAVMPPPAMPLVFVAALIVFGVLFGLFSLREARADRTFSVTGTIAALCVFMLGGLAVTGEIEVAAAGGTVLAAVLASREILHQWLRRITWIEIRSAIVLAVMTAVILPLLPNRTVDPWGGLNPWDIWLFTVLTAAISYVGYILIRIAGPTRGLALSSLAGGLVSSTATVLALARQAATGGPERLLSAGAALASMVSVLRASVIVLIVSPSVFLLVIPVTAVAASVLGIGGGLLMLRASAVSANSREPGNPFQLMPLLVFAAFFAAVSTLNAALSPRLGEQSVIVSAAVSGLFDVDVAVLSSLRLTAQAIASSDIALAVLSGMAANALVRLGIAYWTPGIRFFAPFATLTLLAIGSGVVVWSLIHG